MGDVIVLMLSCDHYSAAWPAFRHGFRKYWPDCPWDLMVKAGKRGWSDTAIAALKRVGAPIVLLMFEDHWLTDPVDTGALMDFAEHVRGGHADHIRLKAGDLRCEGVFPRDSRLAMAARNERYRACLQPALWRVEALLGLLRPGETAWEFERHSAKRTEGSEKYLCVRSSHYFPYALDGEWGLGGPILKGRWTDAAVRYVEREGLEIDFSQDPRDRA